MSIYTPIFPPLSSSPMRLASTSSASSSSMMNTSQNSDSARLTRLHLALASLPAEIEPPSRPSSPEFQSRVEKLRVRIEESVKQTGDAREIVKLNSVLFGGIASAESYSRPTVTEEDGPWPLVETEEEWINWEREWLAKHASRSNDAKGKQRETIPLKSQPTLSSREKVANWQAGVQTTPPTDSTTPVQRDSQSSVKITGNSLGFPVVKRPSILKDAKAKQQGPSPNFSQSTQPTQSQKSKPQDVEVPDSGGSKHGSTTEQTNDLRLSQVPQSSSLNLPDFPIDFPTSTPKALTTEPRADEDVSPPEPSNTVEGDTVSPTAGDTSVTIPPPSFPADLPTSTPKLKETVESTTSPAPVDSNPESDLRVVEAEVSVEHRQDDEPMDVSSDEIVLEKVVHQAQMTGLDETTRSLPSPPISTASPQRCISPDQPMFEPEPQEGKRVTQEAGEGRVDKPPMKITRPLTPTSEASMPTPKVPRTPERQKTRHHRFISEPLSPTRDVPTSSTLPVTPTSRPKGIGNSKGLPFPTTPERNGNVVPPHVDLLATSRRSRIRPSTASQKSAGSVNGEDEADVDAQLVSPSPTKSLFSSLASSSPLSGSSGSGPGSGSSMISGSRFSAMHAPREPESPLQFTQNPSQFAPRHESTQPISRPTFSIFANSQGLSKYSPTKSSQAESTASRLGRASSGLMGMVYSSQFNVNEHAHRVSDFIEKDVDFTAWVHDNDDEDDVEVGTQKAQVRANSQL